MPDRTIGIIPRTASIVNDADLIEIEQLGLSMHATAALIRAGAGSFLADNTARVDSSGSDSTGVVGDLTKPFLTVAVALAAFEALSLGNKVCTILINGSFDETLTTSLRNLVFIGNGSYAATAFSSLSLTDPTSAVTIQGIGIVLGSITAVTSNQLVVDITQGGIIALDITHTGGGQTVVFGNGSSGSAPAKATFSAGTCAGFGGITARRVR